MTGGQFFEFKTIYIQKEERVTLVHNTKVCVNQKHFWWYSDGVWTLRYTKTAIFRYHGV